MLTYVYVIMSLRCMKGVLKILKITATGANDGQFDPELRTAFLFSANSLDFSALRF